MNFPPLPEELERLIGTKVGAMTEVEGATGSEDGTRGIQAHIFNPNFTP